MKIRGTWLSARFSRARHPRCVFRWSSLDASPDSSTRHRCRLPLRTVHRTSGRSAEAADVTTPSTSRRGARSTPQRDVGCRKSISRLRWRPSPAACSFKQTGCEGRSSARTRTRTIPSHRADPTKRAPVCPAEPYPGCLPQPAPGARIVIFEQDGREVASSVTDDAGGYRVRLPAGEYRVALFGRTSTRARVVTVHGGQQTRVDLRVDTGAR